MSTTPRGVRVADTDHALKAGPRGPILLEDFHLREKISHFDHERTRGFAVKFYTTEDNWDLVGNNMPVFFIQEQGEVMFDRLRALINRPRTAEDDVSPDPAIARTREVGGGPRDDGDAAATTGTGDSGEFVGRVSGQDEGFAEESGAEVRAEHER